MRVFASDTIKKMMGRFGIPEDQPIENYLITRSLETAQTKIEGFNFDARKHVLEYDDVLNFQRKTVYDRRRAILLGDKDLVKAKMEEMVTSEEGKKAIDEKIKALGEDIFFNVVRRILLQAIDTFWVEHLESMDYLRGSVNLRAYGQRDPLVEYKREGLKMFKEMQLSVAAEVERLIPFIGVNAFAQAEQKLIETKEGSDEITGVTKAGDEKAKQANENKVGRNEPCPCGSGKKYKHCCGNK